jgi:ABC-type bacteriocin/lantibiotic exporter with double-glycine peptidase domain
VRITCPNLDGEGPVLWVTKHGMFNVMGILPQALSITKKESASALVQPFLAPPSKDASDDKNATKEHYAIKHFRRQSRTALSIIGISVVIALLGVIAPLGFQTFTDKILPYQAQSSLMVIAILLLVAAIRKVPQKVVLSPLAKAAHKKTL